MKSLVSMVILTIFLSQSAFSQIKIGVKGGLNLANITLTGDLKNGSSPQILPGFNVGGILEFPITETVGIRSGLEYSVKGSQSKSTTLGTTTESKNNPAFLQVPVVIAYNGSLFYLGAGPFAGIGVTGKTKVKTSGGSISVDSSTDIKFGSGEGDNISSLDAGLRIEAGVKLGTVRIGANYDLGLSDLIPNDQRSTAGGTAKSNVIGVYVGFMF